MSRRHCAFSILAAPQQHRQSGRASVVLFPRMNTPRLNPTPLVTALCLSLAITAASRADVKLPAVLASHMVLQQGVPLPVWGWAETGEKVTVRFDEQNATTTADAKGNWRVELKPLKADGKAHRMTVSGKNTITFDDVLIGEVWLGSGQSNMAYALGKNADELGSLPEIRLLQIPQKYEKKPMQNVEAEWKVFTPDNSRGFSAALGWFGKRLNEELKVPIGLINSSRGSTAIQQFMPPPKAGILFNGSIAPLTSTPIRGVLWYQGEADVQQGTGAAYAGVLRTMIEGWRAAWGRDFPFYIVQLAPLANYAPDTLPPVWEAQAAMLKVPKTGLVVTTDLAGNMGNIHPGNKKDVGLRLAAWALARDYGRKEVVFSGPLYKAMAVEGRRIRLTFAHADGGLKSRDGKSLTEFQIAGTDGKFVPASATIEGATVLVEAPEVAAPIRVRFAWKNAPSPNLTNVAGLPASPFHTDSWTGGTGE